MQIILETKDGIQHLTDINIEPGAHRVLRVMPDTKWIGCLEEPPVTQTLEMRVYELDRYLEIPIFKER